MKPFTSVANKHPFIFVLSLTILWFVLALAFTGIASGALRLSYGDATTATIGRLAVTACLLFLVWRMGWPEASVIVRLGRWQVWLLALGGLIYFASASLYSFYGKVVFDFSSLIRLPSARIAILAIFVVGLSEEIMFRGVALHRLVRVWGPARQGVIGSVVLSSLLFSVLHITQVFTNGVPISLVLLLALETWIISMWWAALVLLSSSIWPAVMLHFIGNAVVAVQGLTVPAVEPDILAYTRLLWFSILPGLLGLALLIRSPSHPFVPEAP